jgi:O-antigen ligase
MLLAAGALLLAGLTAILLLAPGTLNHGEKWEYILNQPQNVRGTAGDLIEVWSFSLDYLSQHPLSGIGYGRYSFELTFPEFMEGKNPLLGHTHNIFMDLALQLGLPGLLIFLLFMGLLLKLLWPLAPPTRGQLPACFRLAALLMIVAFMIRNFTDDFFFGSSVEFFWALIASALASRNFPNARDYDQAHRGDV